MPYIPIAEARGFTATRGKTAKKFKQEHGLGKDDSIREYLEPWQAEAIQKLQRFDVGLVVAVPSFEQRKKILQTYFDSLTLQVTGSELRQLVKTP